MTFSEKVVLVAGGTGGLGRAVTLSFLEQGARVIVTHRKREEFASLQREAAPRSSSLSGHEVDVTAEASVDQLLKEVVAAHGRLDALVNTVGGYSGGQKFWDTELATFDRMLSINLRSTLLLARAAVPVMLRQQQGAIVNVLAKAALDHSAGLAAYAASKASALALTNSLAEDLRGTGVRVNSILPSIIDTDMNRQAMPNADFSKWPKPQDIAQVILFLCSDAARVIHGAAIPVYGGA